MKEFSGFKKGINLGGWISQYGAENKNEDYFNSFITKSDIDTINGYGADHVRLPIDSEVIMNADGTFIESGFGHVDDGIKWARENGLNIVLDIHKTEGYVFDDETCNAFFKEKALQDLFVNMWVELAKRYGNCEDIAFELLNEITDPKTADIWNDIAERTVAEIRKVASETRIIIGGIYNSSIVGLDLLKAPADENIVFTFHCYSPMIFTHQTAYWVKNMPSDYCCPYPVSEKEGYERSLERFGNDYSAEYDKDSDENIGENYFIRMFEQAVRVSEKYDVPLYCGEFGVIDRAPAADTVIWFRDILKALKKYDIGYSVWTYKEKDFGICGDHYAAVRDDLIRTIYGE